MPEIEEEVQLVVTSPPYYNAPYDYPGLFKDYREYLDLITTVADRLFNLLSNGRIVAIVIDDMFVEGRRYSIVADVTKIFIDAGFRYRDKIIWRKPEGYIRISRRSGVLVQHPYPMYFYPDNLQENILIFQKGEFNYQKAKKRLNRDGLYEKSRIDIEEYHDNKWYLNVWDISNVLPVDGRLEKGIAAFPAEIPYRLIKLFSYVDETVLDPFLGSVTVTKVAKDLDRNSIGYEVDAELVGIIKEKIGYAQTGTDKIDITVRDDAKKLRSSLQEKIPVKGK